MAIDQLADLEARRIGRQASDSDQWLLQDVDLAIRGGDRIAVFGPSGSGKSLLLRTLSMLDAPTTGEILWHGEPVRGQGVPRFRARVIYMPQQPSLIEGTVEENLRQAFALKTHRDQSYSRERVQSLLATLDRDESFLTKQQRDLSGGEAQITAVMRAILLAPTILLLDEPTASLDSASADAIEKIIDRWQDELADQRAFVWVTHNIEQARRVAQQHFQMKQGSLSLVESP